jgi:hypothetical protein
MRRSEDQGIVYGDLLYLVWIDSPHSLNPSTLGASASPPTDIAVAVDPSERAPLSPSDGPARQAVRGRVEGGGQHGSQSGCHDTAQ